MALAVEIPGVTIRNTFIEMRAKPSCAVRRSHSAPALVAVQEVPLLTEDADVQRDMCTPSPPSKCSEEASTDACTDASGDEESVSCRGADTSSRREASSPVDRVLMALLQPVVAVAGEARRSPLSSKAKAWSPIAKAKAEGQGQLETRPAWGVFQLSAMLVIQEVAAMVRQFRFCLGAEVCWHGSPGSPSACTVKATLGLEHMQFTERLATAAKEAILSCTSRSRGVCLLGSKRHPFTPTPQGFVAVVGSGPEPERGPMCRNLYGFGFCNYGGACRHQHPNSTISLNFLISVAVPGPGVLAPYPSR